MNEVPLLPDLKAGFPEVKPGTGSLIFVGTTVRLSVALLLWGLYLGCPWPSPQCTHTALFKAGEGQAPVHSRPQGFMQMSFVVDDIMVGSGLV